MASHKKSQRRPKSAPKELHISITVAPDRGGAISPDGKHPGLVITFERRLASPWHVMGAVHDELAAVLRDHDVRTFIIE